MSCIKYLLKYKKFYCFILNVYGCFLYVFEDIECMSEVICI